MGMGSGNGTGSFQGCTLPECGLRVADCGLRQGGGETRQTGAGTLATANSGELWWALPECSQAALRTLEGGPGPIRAGGPARHHHDAAHTTPALGPGGSCIRSETRTARGFTSSNSTHPSKHSDQVGGKIKCLDLQHQIPYLRNMFLCAHKCMRRTIALMQPTLMRLDQMQLARQCRPGLPGLPRRHY